MDELERGREAIAVIEYAAQLKTDKRRGVFIIAWLEDESWAVKDFKEWQKEYRNGDKE